MWCLQNTFLQLFSAIFTLLFWYHIKKICVVLEEYMIFTIITEIRIIWTIVFRPDVHKKKKKIGNVAKTPDRLFGRIKSRNAFSKLSKINVVLAMCTPWTFHTCFHLFNWLVSWKDICCIKMSIFWPNSNNLAKKCSTTPASPVHSSPATPLDASSNMLQLIIWWKIFIIQLYLPIYLCKVRCYPLRHVLQYVHECPTARVHVLEYMCRREVYFDEESVQVPWKM